jgi:hypothetical protein
MEQYLAPIVITAAAIGTSLYRRWRDHQRQARETARHVEAERIIALLSAKQPGVWDHEELRSRIRQTAEELWSLPTREQLARLEPWVSPKLLAETCHAWPAQASERQVKLQFRSPVSFVQVNEGGPALDRLVARLTAQAETTWFDNRGKAMKQEKRSAQTTYHTWVHIDGQGWHLEAIAPHAPTDEPPPFSVSCRILPQEEGKLEKYR